MEILGFVKTSTVDYPKKIVSTIFLGNCNLNCDYCQNKELIEPKKHMKNISLDEVIKHLKNRKKILDGICISGGEATLHGENLIELVDRIKNEMGDNFLIKLDTNGTNPEFLKAYIDKFDFIAMDFKTLNYKDDLKFYDEIIEKSLEILKNSKVDYEIRITLYPPYIKEADFEAFTQKLIGVKKVVLQQYKVVEDAHDDSYNLNIIYEFKKILENKGIESNIRC